MSGKEVKLDGKPKHPVEFDNICCVPPPDIDMVISEKFSSFDNTKKENNIIKYNILFLIINIFL